MEERIIFAVSSKPCLFDTTADSYRDINTKNAAWRQVSTIVGLPEEDWRRKWRGLRDRYQRERRTEKEKKRSGSAASGQQPWRFCHILSFLDPFIVPWATSGNFTARPSTTSSTSVVPTGASRPSMSPTTATIASTAAARPSTMSTSSTSMTTIGAARPLYNVYIIHKYDHHRCSETLYNVYIIHKYHHHRCSETLYNVYIIHKYDHHRCSETLYNVYIIHEYHHHRCSETPLQCLHHPRV
ncbi:uncharacterized protein [Salmo salar]|uniref:MADF domain-containing protein n=1 Tax=Salmo salar TaxID=8030 RepID=A0ABM3ELL2_SALSA|nr:uncharacterized protein LOC106599480 [Salmo salar]